MLNWIYNEDFGIGSGFWDCVSTGLGSGLWYGDLDLDFVRDLDLILGIEILI